MGLMLSTENSTPSEESLCEVVYNIVAQIPRGRVLTYGAIALPMGSYPATVWYRQQGDLPRTTPLKPPSWKPKE